MMCNKPAVMLYKAFRERLVSCAGVTRLRRALWLLAAIAWTATAMLYWRQQSDDRIYRLFQMFYWSSVPRWSWICKNDRCERMSTSAVSVPQSLQTCNMLCASTQLWPQPTGPITLATSTTPISSKNVFLKIQKTTSPEVTEHLYAAFALMKEDLAALEGGTGGGRREGSTRPVHVHVSINTSADPRLRLDTDEAYELRLNTTFDKVVVEILASSFCGARHGFETLSQLVWHDPYTDTLLTLEGASIIDAPVFHYRGILLDTARNFFPVSDILRTIDAMAASKLNTFHWHATDSQSFPLRLKSVPKLAEYGSYGPDAVYTTEDIKAVVRRASLRGIRVVIEVDAPAHVGRAWSWGPAAGLGELAHCVEAEPWSAYCGEPPCGQLNPKNDNVYLLLEKVYAEILQLTGVTDVFHLGGDEVSESCWEKHLNETPPMHLWLEFTKRSLKALVKANGGVAPELIMLWSSPLTKFPHLYSLDSKQITVQVWGDSHWEESIDIHKAGFRTILSHVDAWYLDCGFGSWRDDSDGPCGEYHTWQHIYKHRPWAVHDDIIQHTSDWDVQGGVACQWTEQLGTENLDSRMWPRAAALAERLWTDADNPPVDEEIGFMSRMSFDGQVRLKSKLRLSGRAKWKVPPDVYLRLDTHRARLVTRGVRAAQIWPRWCSQNPHECN